MEEKFLELDFSQFLFSVSRALDAVESEVLGAAGHHSQRVALLSVLLAKRLGLNRVEQVDLAAYACLHDNALTEYITAQRRRGVRLPAKQVRDDFQYHCEAGEKNTEVFPFLGKREGIILYHHENYDGSGFFHRSGEQIPLMARILRLTDQVDVLFRLADWSSEKRQRVFRHLEQRKTSFYDPVLVDEFRNLLTDETAADLSDKRIWQSLQQAVPGQKIALSYDKFLEISSVFAHIIDYKSPFTMNHSKGIAEKTRKMAEYYEFDEKTRQEIYIAAYLHDIGKLAVPDEYLEKPGKLTGEEFAVVKKHAFLTHDILSVVDSFQNISRWASSHHERLDGSGYFRGCTADKQDFCSRLLACIDVYQALVEDRPYRAGMQRDSAIAILQSQAQGGKLDGEIVRDITNVLE